MLNKEHITVVDTTVNHGGFGIQGLWDYRDLIKLFVKRNLVMLYKQTVLGPLWLFISPLATSLIFTFVFGQYVGLSTDDTSQFLFFLSGFNMWTMFNTTVINVAGTFTQNSQIFGKIYFPRMTVPLSQAFTSGINFLIQLAVLFIFYLFEIIVVGTPFLSWRLVLIPVLLLQCAVLGLGIGLIIASFTIRYRDLANAISFGMLLWMYLTPVLYSISNTGGAMRFILLANPVTPIVYNFRYALFGNIPPLLGSWAISAVLSALLLLYGLYIFEKKSKTFLDTI